MRGARGSSSSSSTERVTTSARIEPGERPRIFGAAFLSRLAARGALRLSRFLRGGLLALDRHDHFLLARRRLAALLGLRRRDLDSFGLSASEALLQRIHEVHDVLALGPRLGPDRLAAALGVDELVSASS